MNLEFKKIQREDIPFVNTVRNQYAEKYLHDSKIFSMFDTYEWFQKKSPDYWIIFDKSERIGYFRLSNHSTINKNIYIGADIAPQYTNMGYGKASYLKFIPFIFEKYGLNKLTLEVLSTNEVAISLYKKLGFIYEGTKRQEIYKNGIWVDSILMSMLKSEYKNEDRN